MKKIISVVVALVLLCVMSVNAFAAGFVPSIEVKNAPGIVPFEEDGKELIGKIVDAEGKTLSEEKPGCIVVIPVADAKETAGDSEGKKEVKKDLLESYEALKKDGTKGLDGLVDKGLAVRDMFAVFSECADVVSFLPIDGNKLELKFKLGLKKDEKIQAVILVDGKWEKLPIVNNGDGTVTATFEDLGIVAFLGKTTGASPDTGDHSGAELGLWIGLMAVSAIAIVLLLVFMSRKKKEE